MDPTNDFSALLDELAQLQTSNTEMAKAMKTEDAEDDAKIAAAADTDGDGKAEGAKEGADGDGDADDKGGDKDSEYFGKSFGVTLADGTEVQAYDGTEAIRLLNGRVGEVGAAVQGQGEQMAKALSSVLGAVKGMQSLIGDQAEMLKSLRAEVATLRTGGTGRKAVLDVHEQRSAVPPKAEGATPTEVMTKALSAQYAGRITALDVARIESRLGRGEAIPAELLASIA